MAKITAKGKTEYFGKLEIVIEGGKYVNKITSDDEEAREFFAQHIKAGDGELANAYHPEPNTMLQAFAFCCEMFSESDIHIEGNIGEIECKEGVIY